MGVAHPGLSNNVVRFMKICTITRDFKFMKTCTIILLSMIAMALKVSAIYMAIRTKWAYYKLIKI